MLCDFLPLFVFYVEKVTQLVQLVNLCMTNKETLTTCVFVCLFVGGRKGEGGNTAMDCKPCVHLRIKEKTKKQTKGESHTACTQG